MEDNQVQSVGDPLKDLYTEFNPKLNLAKSFDEFKSTMQDPANRKSFFDEFNSKLNLAKDYDQFDETLGLKKKDGGTPSVSSVTPSPSTVQPTQEYKSNDYTLADGTQMSNVAPQKPIQQDNGGFDVNKSVDKINGLKQKLDTYNNIVAQSSFNDDDKRELRRLNGELGANIGSLATRGQNPLDQEGYNNSVKNYNETSNKINALLSKKGGMTDDQIADYKNTVDELNGEIGKINEFDKNSQVSKINPVTEERYQAVDKVRQMLAKSSPQGIHEANELNHYQTNENFDQLIHSTQSQLDIIDKSELTPEQKEESRGLLRQSNSPLINSLDTELARKYNDPNNEFKGVLTPDEYAGLMTLKMFDPTKYDNAVGAITTKITPKYEHSSSFDLENLAINSDSKESDETISQKIGKESTLRNLGEIGRQNKSVFVAEKMHDLSNNYVNTDDATQKENIQNQIAAYQSTNNAIAESRKGDDTRFPLTTQLNLDNQVKELTQEAGMNPAESILYKFGKGFGATVNSMQNVATGLFGSDEDNNRLKMQRAGESAIEQGEQYLPEEYKKMKSPVIPVFNKELITEKNKILSDPYLSDIEKKQKLATAVFNNQDKIDYITNPNKGKSANVWSMATVYGNAGMIGDIASIAAQSYMMGMGGASHMLSATVPMFLSTQNSFYQQAIEEGRRDPQSYANLHALIMAAAGLINPDLDIVKRTLGMKTATGKIIAGIDESTWNALVSKNRPTIDKIIGGAKAAAAETAKMGLIYGAGTSIASNVADKYFFNKKISASEIADQAIDETKNTIINSLGLITFNGIENGRNTNFVSPDSKAVIWQLGHNEDIGKAFIDEHLKNGDITEAEAKQKKEIISKIASLIDKVPDLNNNNKPLTDKQKVDYLYNLFIKTKLSELKQSLPDSKKEAIKAKEEEIDNANSKIFNTTVKVNDIAPTEDKTETTLPEHQEIGHQILSHVGINPNSEGPKVYDATNIHTIDTDGMDEVQTKVVGDVGKIISSVSNLVQHTTGSPLTITLHDSPKTYREAVLESGGTKQDATTKGFYLDKTGQIHLNMANVTSETLMHEAFHPVLDYLAEKNPGIIDEFHQQLSKLKGGQEVIDNAIQNYDGDITQKKEAITDYIAKVANGDIQLDRSAFEKVKDWIVNTLKTLGLPIEKSIESINDLRNLAKNIESINDLRDLAKNISHKFNTGEELKTEFHPIENNGEHGSALGEGTFTKDAAEGAKVGDVNPLQAQFSKDEKDDKFKEVGVRKLPVKSLEEVRNEFGGRAVAINSDPTRVGHLKLPSGKDIFMYGGAQYMALEPNVKGEIGFASTTLKKPKIVEDIVKNIFKDRNSEGVVLVATQKPESMLGNAYSLEYTLDAITILPKKILRSTEFKNEFFGKDIVSIKDAFGKNEYEKFVKKYRSADFSSPEVMASMIKDLLADIGNNFAARNSLVDNLLAGIEKKNKNTSTKNDEGYYSKKPNKYISKALFEDQGLNQERLFKEIGVKALVDSYMNEGKWGYVVGGFTSDAKKSHLDIQDNGIIHPQFNSKFHGKDPFLLDGAYLIDKLWKPEVNSENAKGETYVDKKTGEPKPYTKKASLMVAGSMYPKGNIDNARAEIKKPIPQFSREQNENEDIVSASVNVAPLYSTKVETPEQASQMQSSEFYKEFKRKNEELATRFGLKVNSQKDGIGGFAGVSEATTVVNVTGKFEDIVKYAAVSGALTPEVQESTIAGMYVKEGSSYHNADKLEVGIDNMDIAMKAAKDAGFDENGYTLLNDEISFFDIHEFRTEGFDKKIDIFASKYEEYGGQITRKEKHAVRSEYIDAEKRKDIISTIQGDAVQYKQDRSGLRDELENAKERNENFLKWKDVNDSDAAKEYRDLRQKQLDLSESGEALSDKEDARIKELESKLSEPLASIISSNKKQYEKAKIEIDSVAHDVASLVAGGFKSEFGIKRPSRAAVKVVRWYDIQPNNLGDGARANVIVNTNADADFLFNEMKRRFKSTLNRDEGETTNLGYPKRLIEVRTKTGKIAEIQVMTPQGYLAKDGIKHFPEDAKAKAEKSLDEVRSRLGWDIPDGVGHYFYELHRDPNVPNEIKKQAEVISNKYYQAFLNPESTLTDNEFRTEITDFKNKVDTADKSKWDNGNEGHAPEELNKYLEEQTPEFSKGNNLDRKISSAIDAQRQAGQSEEAIKKGLESVREHLGITDDDITRLMTPKEEPKTAEPVKAEPSQKQSSGTLISKAGLKESEYPFSKEFDERGGQEVATDMLSRIKSQATRNHITLEDQLAKKVASMKGGNPPPTEYNIISAGTHLLNIDKRIQAAIESGHNTDALVRERMETAEVLRRLGNNAGRNLGLFNLIFKDANRSEIKVEVNRIQKALKVKDLSESMADLNARLNKGEIDKYEYAKVKPYVEKIEEVKNAIAKMETEFQEKARLENRKTEEAALKEAYNKGKEDALNSKKPVLERRGNKELADKLRGLKINKRGESPSTPEEARPQFSNENGSSKEERWASKIDDIAALVEKEMTIKEAIAQLITEGTLEKGDKIGVEQFIAKTIQAESSIDKLKASAEGGEKTITDQMVKDGTIKDIVEGVLHSGLSYDKVIDEATAQIKEVLPDVTRANVSDAYFRKGDFALETKKKLNESIDEKRQQVRLLARKEAIVAAHEDAADVHTASTKEEKNRIISEKEKEYDEKIKQYEIDKKEANKFYGESDAAHRRIEGLEDELSDLQKNIVKEKDATKKIEYTEREQALRDKISKEKKRISNEEKEANKFYGESDAGNRKLESMQDELDRLTARKEKNNTPAEEKEISEKQQELQRKIDAERRAWNKEKYLEKIKEERDYVELNRKVFVKAIKNKSEAEKVYKLAKEGLDKAYSEAGLRRETGELRPVQVERMYQNEVDKVNGDTSMSDEEKKAKLEDLKAQRETDLAGTKQGVISQLSDSLEDLRKRLMDRANKALENEDKKSFDEHNKLNMKIQGIISDLNPNGENLVDVANKAYGKLEALLKDESLSSESKAALEKIKRDFENNSKLTYNEMSAKRLKAQWEAEIRAKETKINSGDYSEMPENKFDFRTNEDLMLLNAKRQALTGKLKNLANEAKEKNKDWLDKALGLSSKLLVSGVHTIMKVTEAGSFKPVMDSIVELSAGNMVSGLTQTGRTSLGDVGEGMKALAAFRNKDAALRYVEKTKVNRANALEELGKAIQNGNKDAIAKADEAFKKADLIHAIATIYRSIDANSLVTFWNYVAHASTDYDEMMGKGGKKYMEDYKTKLEKTGYVLDGWIRMHSAMKTSLSARQALLRSFSSTLTEFQRQGRPLNEANISLAMIIANDAYEEGRLTNKTAVSKAVTGLKNSENAVVRKGSNIIFPVSTIAFNIAKRGIDYSSLGAEGWTRLALESKKGMRLNEAEGKEYDGWFKAVKAGISRIPIQERKYINGVISRGMFGAAMTLVTMWGLANGKIKYGGTYDDQRKRKIMGSDHKQLLAGEWEFFGHKMGKLGNVFLNHLPEFMPLALAANHYQIHKAGEGWISGSTISTDLQEVEARLPFQTLLGIFDPNRTMKTIVDRFTRIPLAAELGQELDPLASERDKSNIWNRIKANTGFESFNDSKDQQKAIDNLDKMQSKALAKAVNQEEINTINTRAAAIKESILKQPINAKK